MLLLLVLLPLLKLLPVFCRKPDSACGSQGTCVC